MLSISPCWVESLSWAVEYFSSTGRVRNTQPVTGKTAKARIRARMGKLRLMKKKAASKLFEYIAPERLQKVRGTVLRVYGRDTVALEAEPGRPSISLRAGCRPRNLLLRSFTTGVPRRSAYSALNACIGSRRDARHAGTTHANAATASSVAATAA